MFGMVGTKKIIFWSSLIFLYIINLQNLTQSMLSKEDLKVSKVLIYFDQTLHFFWNQIKMLRESIWFFLKVILAISDDEVKMG